MKVLLAHNRYSAAQPSGENVVVDQERQLLSAAGVEVVLYERSSDEIADWPLGRKLAHAASPVYARRAQRDLVELIDHERPDVLHVHNVYPLLSPGVVRTAHEHRLPVVQTIHNFRHACMKGTFFRDGHDCRDCLGRRVPLPGVVHACYRGSRAQSAVMATTLSAHHDTWRTVDRFVALTEAMATFLGQIGMRREQITVKPNCVPDPGRHDERGSGIAYVGRLSEEKGVPLLLDAWQRHADGEQGPLHVAGDGPLRGLVEQVAARRTDVTMHGWVEHAAGLALMRSAAVVVVPSVWEDVCPMVAIEALANARPLLATTNGGLPYLVGADGGWTVPGTREGLAGGLRTAYEGAAAAAGPARRRYERMFTPEVVTRQLLEVYREVSEGMRRGV